MSKNKVKLKSSKGDISITIENNLKATQNTVPPTKRYKRRRRARGSSSTAQEILRGGAGGQTLGGVGGQPQVPSVGMSYVRSSLPNFNVWRDTGPTLDPNNIGIPLSQAQQMGFIDLPQNSRYANTAQINNQVSDPLAAFPQQENKSILKDYILPATATLAKDYLLPTASTLTKDVLLPTASTLTKDVLLPTTSTLAKDLLVPATKSIVKDLLVPASTSFTKKVGGMFQSSEGTNDPLNAFQPQASRYFNTNIIPPVAPPLRLISSKESQTEQPDEQSRYANTQDGKTDLPINDPLNSFHPQKSRYTDQSSQPDPLNAGINDDGRSRYIYVEGFDDPFPENRVLDIPKNLQKTLPERLQKSIFDLKNATASTIMADSLGFKYPESMSEPSLLGDNDLPLSLEELNNPLQAAASKNAESKLESKIIQDYKDVNYKAGYNMAKDGVNWTSEELADADEDFQKGYLDYLKEKQSEEEQNSPSKKKIGRPKKTQIMDDEALQKQKMIEQGRKDASKGKMYKYPNNEDYMNGYNDYIDNLAYQEFLAEQGDDEAPVTKKPRGRPKKRPPTDNEAGAPLDVDDEVTIGTRFTRYLSPQGRRGNRERKPVERFKPGK
jgi:hypothetical protein